jgi:hypothetical protein
MQCYHIVITLHEEIVNVITLHLEILPIKCLLLWLFRLKNSYLLDLLDLFLFPWKGHFN